jgi:hypothetical protein
MPVRLPSGAKPIWADAKIGPGPDPVTLSNPQGIAIAEAANAHRELPTWWCMASPRSIADTLRVETLGAGRQKDRISVGRPHPV